MCTRRVHVVRPIELGSGSLEPRTPCSLMFQLDTDEPTGPQRHDANALYTRQHLDWLLAPPSCLAEVQAALDAAPAGLEAAAEAVRQMGYAVQVNESAGGSLRALRHTFLSVWVPGGSGIGGQEVIVDLSFADQFAIASPTPRYAYIQSALPRVLVSTAHRTLQAVSLLADELALAFKANDAPLPPWRQLSSLLSKYNAARSAPAPSASFATAGQPVATQMGVGLAARGGAQPAQTQTTDTQDVPPGSAAEPLRLATRFPTQQQAAAAGTAGGAAAASARKAQQARQRVSCKLAQWGLQSAAAQLAAATDLAKASPPSVLLALDRWASGGSGVGSPAAAARPVHTLQIGFTVRECVCSGPAAATHRQRIQRPGQLMSRAQAGQLRAKGRAARAA